MLHKAAAILKEHKAPIAECLVKEIAKPAKDAVTEVCINSLTSHLFNGCKVFFSLSCFIFIVKRIHVSDNL